jgi:hypothetical protein
MNERVGKILARNKKCKSGVAHAPVLSAAFVFVILSGCTSGGPVGLEREGEYISCDRFRLVLLNALAVANPDYRVSWDYSWQSPKCTDGFSGFDARIPVGLTPRGVSTPFRSFVDPVWTGEISQDSSGRLKIPLPGEWKLSRIIQSLGRGASEEGKGSPAFLATVIKKGAEMQAVVELDSPLSEEEVLKIWSTPDVFFFSPGGAQKPIGWDWEFAGLSCDTRGFDFCQGSKSATTAFRQWVSLLRPEDASALQEFGIDYQELRRRASDSRIYGFVMHNLPPQVTRLVDHPQVRSVKIVDIAMNE